jgi:biotin carboxylase
MNDVVSAGQPARFARRILLIVTNHTYRAQPFLDAAAKLDIEVIQAIDLPGQLAQYWGVTLGLDFTELDQATRKIVAFAQDHPLDAIVSVDDSGSLLAARASQALGLTHNSYEAAEAAGDKFLMRQLLSRAGVPTPHFQRFSTADDIIQVAAQIRYPVVVKPLRLSGSRGVMRVDDPAGLQAAVTRLRNMLARGGSGPHPFLVESFIPGVEVALEGILDGGRLTILALFDKPDPLDGPFFEETIYVTPSRLPDEVQQAIANRTAHAAAALGLHMGPIHAELRINDEGAWIVEVAGRSIGGLCSKTLQFGTDASLEELILRKACGMEIVSSRRKGEAGGVMMIPIPEAGILKGFQGCEQAAEVPLIEGVEITARLNYPLVPLPEGESYLGFIFARGGDPAAVEAALREAHSKLRFEIAPHFPLAVVQAL